MDIRKRAQEILRECIPEKSRDRYLKTLKEFTNWLDEQNCTADEDSVLVYLQHKSKTLAPNSLFSVFSMLKKCLPSINMGSFHSVKGFLKNKNKGYRPNKARTFTASEFDKFILEADDFVFLLHKVILILGISGAMRCNEIFVLNMEDVVDKETFIQISVKDTKNYVDRQFFIIDTERAQYANIIRKYNALRPPNRSDKRYLTAYNKGKSTNLPVGINKIRSVPGAVASYLGLSEPEKYTGHTSRRSSATLFADAGGNLGQLKQLGGWKSSTVAESYVDQSTVAKLNAARRLLTDTHDPVPSTSAGPKPSTTAAVPGPSTSIAAEQSTAVAPVPSFDTKHVTIEAANNCSFVINIINNNNQ